MKYLKVEIWSWKTFSSLRFGPLAPLQITRSSLLQPKECEKYTMATKMGLIFVAQNLSLFLFCFVSNMCLKFL
jgi:hypothetical protein